MGALPGPRSRAFTVVEVLVVVAVIAVLVSLLLPALSAARRSAREAVCLSNQRQLVLAWTMYALDYRDRAMPLAYFEEPDVGPGDEQIFWWGSHGSKSNAPETAHGILAPYLNSNLAERSVYECPEQRWGTYKPQGPNQSITSTYGYNGYYLSPSKTPGWSQTIKNRPWRRVGDLEAPTRLLVFADTLLPPPEQSSAMPGNTALLDPPLIFDGDKWIENEFPTTAFRHGPRRSPRTNAACADGGARSIAALPGWITRDNCKVGSIGTTNDPWYVPDWKEWNPGAY